MVEHTLSMGETLGSIPSTNARANTHTQAKKRGIKRFVPALKFLISWYRRQN